MSLIYPLIILLISCSIGNKKKESYSKIDNLNYCNCENFGLENIYSITKSDISLCLCGYIEEEFSEKVKILSPILVNTTKSDTLYDFSNNETRIFYAKKEQSSIEIYSTRLILDGDNWDYKLLEYEKFAYEINNKGHINISITNVFNPDIILSSKQIEDLEVIYSEFEKKEVLDNFNEKKVYMLYTAFLSGERKAEYILKTIRNKYDVDGAVSESLSEIGF